MARYRKIDSRMWNDEKVHALSDDGKLALVFLLTHPGMTALGAMRATLPGLAAELGWHERKLRACLSPAISQKMVIIDESAAFLRLRNFLRYNQPENPNQVRGWAGAVDLIPECSAKATLLHDARTLAEALGKPFADAFRERFPERLLEPCGHGLAIQEQEQLTTLGGKPPSGSNGKHGDPFLVEFETEIKPVYPKRDGDHRWKRAFSGYRSARKAGEPLDVVRAGVERYSAYCERHQLVGTRSVKMAATFFGEEKSWREEWTAPDVPERPYTPA